jgi:hypothetical protein
MQARAIGSRTSTDAPMYHPRLRRTLRMQLLSLSRFDTRMNLCEQDRDMPAPSFARNSGFL